MDWLRIKELERRSGVSRRNIHFYLQQGLLHPPRRTGRTMAYYDQGHVEELARIRAARKSGVPLLAIKRSLDDGAPGAGAGEETVSRTARRSAADAIPPVRAATGRTRTPRGPSRGRSRPREGMREKVLEVGCRLFLTKGYRATAVSDVTGRLGVGKGTFYHYFRDKDALFLECAPRIFEALFGSSWNRIRQQHDPLQRLAERCEAVLPVLDRFCAVLALCREALQSDDPEIRAMGRSTIVSIRRPLEDDLTKGMAQGRMRALDPLVTSVMLIGVMESLQYLDATEAHLDAAALRNAVAALITTGIRGSGGSAA